MAALPRIAMSMGDPAGIGPELCLRLLQDTDLRQQADLSIVGHAGVLQRQAELLGLARPDRIIGCGADADAEASLASGFGHCTAAGGRLALAAIDRACDGCRDGDLQALVTAPVNKQALALAGCPHPGHTEYLAERCGVDDVAMLLSNDELAIALVTIHQSLASVPGSLRSEDIVRVAGHLHRTLRQAGHRTPCLGILGLNPHASDGGRFGDEEERIIAPAIDALRTAGIDAHGPLPPDTAFTPEQRTRFAGYVCQYHDQGLILFKALAWQDGVNVTMGLPIIRTSPDHGTAYDIAGQGLADGASMRAALRKAVELCGRPA